MFTLGTAEFSWIFISGNEWKSWKLYLSIANSHLMKLALKYASFIHIKDTLMVKRFFNQTEYEETLKPNQTAGIGKPTEGQLLVI